MELIINNAYNYKKTIADKVVIESSHEIQQGTIFNGEKLFDEKVKMLKTEYEKFVKAGDLENAESYRLAIVIIKSEARQYMINTATDLKPKTFASTISKIIG